MESTALANRLLDIASGLPKDLIQVLKRLLRQSGAGQLVALLVSQYGRAGHDVNVLYGRVLKIVAGFCTGEPRAGRIRSMHQASRHLPACFVRSTSGAKQWTCHLSTESRCYRG